VASANAESRLPPPTPAPAVCPRRARPSATTVDRRPTVAEDSFSVAPATRRRCVVRGASANADCRLGSVRTAARSPRARPPPVRRSDKTAVPRRTAAAIFCSAGRALGPRCVAREDSASAVCPRALRPTARRS
jgi:hypothetical protein